MKTVNVSLPDDVIDIRLRQGDERQHGRRERSRVARDEIGRHDDIVRNRTALDRCRERTEDGRREEIAHVGVQADAAHAFDERHGQQRMAAEREEVILPAHAIEAQQLGPQIGER